MSINIILSRLIFILLRLLNFTYRYRFHQNNFTESQTNKNYILAIWHQNLLPGILAQTGTPHIVIISKSKDADPVAYACKKLGHMIVRGSSKKGDVDKGGKLAKEKMIDFLKKGFPGAVTVDGPKGPAFEVKPGIVDMAKKANVPIIPYAIALSSFWEFKSWDKFRLPKPFSKILISYANAIEVHDEKLTFIYCQTLIEEALKLQSEIVNSKIQSWNQCSKINLL